MTPYDDHSDDFLATAVQAMRTSGGAAVDALGWWELVPHVVEDADARAAVFAVFRAQGRELVDSVALGGLLAQPYLDRVGREPGTVVAAVRRRSARRGPAWSVVGDVAGRDVLVDEPGLGVFVIEPDTAEWHRVDIPGRALVHEVSVDLSDHEPTLADAGAHDIRARSTYLGRVAAATEILGAAEGAVDLAVEHACQREQFGQPIGSFQAVRHLLAWAQTDCVAVEAVVREALSVVDRPPARYGETVKALAGRNGRRACQRSLQVLGGIGFTAEHPHHHHHSRVLLLDGLLGASAELTNGLGAWLRTSRTDPGYARAILHTDR
jgi:hypothetical protein